MTNGWMNRASDHGKAVPAGAFPFFRVNYEPSHVLVRK